MKKQLLLTLLWVPFVLVAQAQKLPASLDWQKNFGGSKADKAYSVIPTVDNGFLVVGSSCSNDGNVSGHHGSTDSSDAWVIKLNSSGDLEWQQSYGGSNRDEFIHAVQAGNGDFIAVGATRSTDGDVTGLHTSNGDAFDLWLVRINRYGVIQWSKAYGGSADDHGRVIRKMADGNYMIAGDAKSNDFDVTGNNGGADLWVLKINDQGTLLWQKAIGDPNHQFATSITLTSDNNYLISGYHTYNGYPATTLPMYSFYADIGLKMDAQGNVLWQKSAGWYQGNPGPSTYAYRVLELPSHQLIKVGSAINATTENDSRWRIDRLNSSDGNSTGSVFSSNNKVYGNHLLPEYAPGPDATQILSDSTILACITGLSGLNLSRISTQTPSSNSNFLYQSSYSSGGFLNGVIALQDDEYIAAGYINNDVWIIKVSSLNQVKGKVFVDNNGNGIKDVGESFFKNGFVESKKNGAVTRCVLSANGDFLNFVDTGTYTTSVLVNGRPYYTLNPTSKQSAFASYKNKDSFSFGVTPLPGTSDLQLSLQSLEPIRPGFDAYFRIDYSNVGTTVLANTVIKLVKPSFVSLVSATTPPSSVNADTLAWNVGTLSPFDGSHINLVFQVSPSPAVNLNDVLNFTAAINPVAGDFTPADNADTVKRTVIGSFDPNDKQENHNGTFYIEQLQAGQPLTYTVRFKNMGTDTAFNIVIRDTLSDQLDVSTLEIIGASHTYQFNLKDNKYCTWTSTNILLPDHSTNDPASQGYLTYRIKPKSTLQSGDKISNSASIYFDFNLPVQTNKHETVIAPTPVPAPPQPVVSGLQLNYCGNLGVQKIKVLNLPASTANITITAKLDATVLTIAADSTVSFTVSSLAAGTHNLTITYSNVTDTKTTTAGFTVTAAATPDVNLLASITNVVNLADPVTITAANASGGGKDPLFTFAWNNSFTNIIQTESSNNILSITPSSLALGDNKVFVKMKTSESCYTVQTNIDSITIRRDMSTGITDIDNPGQVITVYPNPVKGPITIDGLSTAKTYTFNLVNLQGQIVFTKRVVNQSKINITGFNGATGTYWLTIYDEKRNRLLGSVKLLKQ